MFSFLLFVLAWGVQAEYDVITALQLTQSALDEQIVVSVALSNSSTNASKPHHDHDTEDAADEDPEDSHLEKDAHLEHEKEDQEPEEIVGPIDVKADSEEDEVPDEEDKDELQIEANASLAKDGRYRTPAERIHGLISKFVYSKPPAVNKHVSKRRPLLFMHQAKSGGTSLREVLYKNSRHQGLSAYIPCNGGVHCQKFDIDGQTAAVYGGHFCWKATTNNLARRGVHQFSCVTIFREPVARIMSCYSYRMVGQLGKAPSCIAHVHPQQLKSKLLDNACVNEPFRRIGDCNVASRLEHRKSDEAQVTAWETTLSHLSGCVPIILEEPESYKVAAHVFPQFSDAFHKMRQVKLNKNKKYDNHCRVSHSHMRAMKEVASHEIRMYKAARKRMWRLREELHLN
ncbi:unnamed protein product [Symbiodinium natans]|uniref:Sulfotransferase n=1 Tax=Symbiodinium natans TaxID=878477 RepID=A0A812KTB9_9DINO|nr:unnamed protein product [Symbiodinium natans]